MISDRFKRIIFNQLYKELGDCEIIPYNDSIWIINREDRHWYFELDGKGCLWWMGPFFYKFFQIFSLSIPEFVPIIVEWVEEVLNCKVVTPCYRISYRRSKVEDILNCKVVTTQKDKYVRPKIVEIILNHK